MLKKKKKKGVEEVTSLGSKLQSSSKRPDNGLIVFVFLNAIMTPEVWRGVTQRGMWETVTARIGK